MGAVDRLEGAAHEAALAAYVPRVLQTWDGLGPGPDHRRVDGTLVLLDVSGFTRLTERLARRGREGAEELSEVLEGVFSHLLTEAHDEGADLLKWGGDALLLLLDGRSHVRRGVRAAARMRRALARSGRLDTSAGRVVLRCSTGVHAGPVDLVVAGDPSSHLELVVLGPSVSRVIALEKEAGAGQVLLSPETARRLDAAHVGARQGSGRLLVTAPRPPTRGRRGEDRGVAPGATATGRFVPVQLREHLTQPSREPEHRTVTVGFLRYEGTDRLLAEDGPTALVAAVDRLLRVVQAATEAHGVSFHESDVDVDGGKVMLVAGAPRSVGDDTDRMLATVRQVVDRAGHLRLRAAVTQGRVFAGDLGPPDRRTYSVKGDAVNLAARLAALATPGEVVAAADVVDHARRSYVITDRVDRSVRGRRKPLATVRLVAVAEDPEGGGALPDAATGLLVGRDAEVAVLEDHVRAAHSGRGALVEVVGESGMGKSRLVEEVLSRATDIAVLRCPGERGGAGTAYTPVRRLLRRLLELPPDAGPAESAARVEAVSAELAADLRPWLPLLGPVLDLDLASTPEVDELEERFRPRRLEWLVAELLVRLLPGPALLAVDDAHLADPATAGVLDRVAAHVSEHPWVVLVTREPSPDGWAPSGAHRLDLGPLHPAAAVVVAELATPERPLPPATVQALVDRAAGRPLMLRELVRAVTAGAALDELPASVEEVVAAEVDRLPPPERSMLRRAAVLGDEVPTELLAAMLDDPADLSDVVARLDGFLLPSGEGRLRFRHPLLREAAYAGLPYRRRRELHARAAAVLETTTSVAVRRPELLALHYFVAGRYEPAWRYARLAGKRAATGHAPEAAAIAYARAAEAARRAPGIPSAERAADLEALGDALYLTGRSTEAGRAYREAVRAAGDDPLRSARLALKQGRVEQRRGHYAPALRRLSLGLRALDGLDSRDARAARARLQVRYAVCRVSQGRYPEARRWAGQAVEEATAAGELDALAQAHLVLHTVTLWSAGTDGERHGETALRLYEQLGDLAGQAHALNNLALRRLVEGRWPDALPMLARASEMFRRVGDATDAANATYNRADVLVRQGRHEEAAPLLEEALRVARAVEDEELVALVLREQGRSHCRSGRLEPGMVLLAEARARFVALGERHEVVDTDVATAEAHLLGSRPEQAVEIVVPALAAAEQVGAATLLPSAHRVHAAALLALDDVVGSRQALSAGLRLSESPDLGHERAYLLSVAARLQRREAEIAADRLDAEVAGTLRDLGVVRVPLPAPRR
ncbi:MAG TPA: tetratricopeptide repeat protein [Jiangellales bacterium]|nr:tetratricopeptide repeat protein [Jiangellales bacterium]